MTKVNYFPSSIIVIVVISNNNSGNSMENLENRQKDPPISFWLAQILFRFIYAISIFVYIHILFFIYHFIIIICPHCLYSL